MKARWFVISFGVFLLVAISLAVTDISWAGWGDKWKKNRLSGFTIKEHNIEEAETADISQNSVNLMTSSVPKLFWVDCGLGGPNEKGICESGTLRYVDPAEPSPVVKTFETGVTVLYDDDRHTIVAANVNTITWQMTDLKVAYVSYFKGGRIWKVDTATLEKTQVSSETSASAGKLCEVRDMEDWDNTLNSTIAYWLAGVDNNCHTGDDIRRAVKLGMSATTSPITLGKRWVMELLFDDRYIVEDWSTGTHKIQICNTNIANCSDITTRTNTSILWWTEDYDADRIIFHNLDGKLMIYKYSTPSALITLYTPASGEYIEESRIDRDGYVYFTVSKRTSPYTNSIRRVPVGGGTVQTLAPFTTTYPLNFLGLDLTPTRLVYFYHNATFSALHVRSIPKAGGTPVNISDTAIGGAAAGDYALIETTAGAVQGVKLSDGTRISRANSQLNGITLGGSADWHYFINPSTLRFFLSSIGNQLKSYAYGEDFTVSTNGIVIGTVPVNLNNFWAFSPGNDLLGSAGKRDEWLSFGNDILFLRAVTANSLKRLTNTNGEKLILQGID